MRPRLLVRALVCCGVVASCARTDKLADVRVQSATLDDFTGASLDMLGGGTYATATLHIVEPGGATDDVPLQITGGELGPMMTMALVRRNFGEGVFDLSHVNDAHGDDLLGPYSGYVVEGGMLAGGSYYELENDRRARFKLGGFELSMGLEMFAGQEWLNFDVAPPDAGSPGDDGSSGDAGLDDSADAGDAAVDGGSP